MTTDKINLKGLVPESWNCMDCGTNTAPGCMSRGEMDLVFAAAEVAGKKPSAAQPLRTVPSGPTWARLPVPCPTEASATASTKPGLAAAHFLSAFSLSDWAISRKS